MRNSHWPWLLLVCAILYLASQLRAPDSRSAVGLDIHAPEGFESPDAPALAEMLYATRPELRDKVTITATGEPAQFEIASEVADPNAALALANSAAESLEGLVTEHFRARLSAKLGDLRADIRNQEKKVEESRRKMLDLIEEADVEEAESEPLETGD